ncbi:MAG: Flp pilus assembly protein CpaB, partial [Myxococcaceae bacterium]
LSAKVPKRGRALTLEAQGTAAVGGWVRPNDHVDVIGSFRDPDTNESVAVTLLQNVVVLATGKITGTTNVNLIPEAQRDYNNLSLLVLPEEAEVLTLAAELGSLTFSLRNEDDVDILEERGRSTIKTLLSGERTRVLQERRNMVIQVIRGSSKDQATVKTK